MPGHATSPRGNRAIRVVVAFLLLGALAAHAEDVGDSIDAYLAADARTNKSNYADVPEFGGPNSVGVNLREDDAFKLPLFRIKAVDRALKPWFDWKGRLNEKAAFAFTPDYTILALWADDSPGKGQASGAIFRFFGSWTPVGRGTENTGSLVFKIEHRHRYSDIAPNQLGFEAGALSLVGAPWSNRGWLLTNFYWHQKLFDGRLAFVVGFVDVTDYLNVYGLASPWLHFVNFEFETGSTIPVPDQGIGATLAGWLSDNVYVVAGLADANPDPSNPGEGFETFFEDREYFVHAEIGLVSSQKARYLDNVHLTFWHVDERENAGTPDGWGLNFSATKFLQEKFMPFFRAGWSQDGGALMEATASVGLGIYFEEHSDLFAVAVGWGRPQDPSLRDQYTVEVFYRWQLTESAALTPDIQLIFDPALNPADDFLFLFGLRFRLAF